MTTLATPPPPAEKFRPPQPAVATQRLMSVDALRGFDMFWIIGADSLVYALHRLNPSKPTDFLANQLEHADWQGFHYLPGKKWDTFFDPEGYLSTIPAIATCLLGVFAGFLLQSQVDRKSVV